MREDRDSGERDGGGGIMIPRDLNSYVMQKLLGSEIMTISQIRRFLQQNEY